MFRTTSITDFAGFNWDRYERELKEILPTRWLLLKAAATSLDTYYKRKTSSSTISTYCVVATSILQKERNTHMSAIQYLLSLLYTLVWQFFNHGKYSVLFIYFFKQTCR